jgi:dodecin
VVAKPARENQGRLDDRTVTKSKSGTSEHRAERNPSAAIANALARVQADWHSGLPRAGVYPRPRAGSRAAQFGVVPRRRLNMAESVYKVIELVGTSTESWEKATSAAIAQASKSLRDLRVAEGSQLDVTLDNGKIESYRAKVKVSFKYEAG